MVRSNIIIHLLIICLFIISIVFGGCGLELPTRSCDEGCFTAEICVDDQCVQAQGAQGDMSSDQDLDIFQDLGQGADLGTQ